MQKKILLSACLLFLSIFSAAAGGQHCRSGMVLAAELTTMPMKIVAFNALAFPNLPQDKAYVVLSIKLDDMRELSIFDYSLEIKGASFPCIAIRRNNNYEYYTGNLSGKELQQIVFAVDRNSASGTSPVTAVLKSNLSESRYAYDVNIPVTVIGNRAPKAPRAIPSTGLIFFR